jgi:predicted alpha-1,2-mannosidase
MGLFYVKKLEVIPTDKESRAVAKGLEYAIGDGSIALMAQRMNKTADYDYFKKRAGNYKAYFDDSNKFFRGKLANGQWTPGFDPLSTNNTIYAEGNAWQYLWLVPQDVKGLISLLGGEKIFNDRLDSMFSLETPGDMRKLADITGTIGQYAHGNEPSHHIAYLYAYGGRQWKTAEKVRYIMEEMYHDKPDGIIGNEDCGQMSAWYIFSSLGFYPVFPASEKYVIGSPLFDQATIHLPKGKIFTIKTKNAGSRNSYVQGIILNGKAYNHAYINHNDIMEGGVMEINMGPAPNLAFARQENDRPW